MAAGAMARGLMNGSVLKMKKAPVRGPLVGCVGGKCAAAWPQRESWASVCQEQRAQKSPARFPGRAQFVSFNSRTSHLLSHGRRRAGPIIFITAWRPSSPPDSMRSCLFSTPTSGGGKPLLPCLKPGSSSEPKSARAKMRQQTTKSAGNHRRQYDPRPRNKLSRSSPLNAVPQLARRKSTRFISLGGNRRNRTPCGRTDVAQLSSAAVGKGAD